MKKSTIINFIVAMLAATPFGFSMTVIKTNHDQRRDTYNQNPTDFSLGTYTRNINRILGKGRVSERHAEIHEKETILKAVMAAAVIHEPADYRLSNSLTSDDPLYKHFEILRLADDLSRDMVRQINSNEIFNQSDSDVYKNLYSFSGVTPATFYDWFEEVTKEHHFREQIVEKNKEYKRVADQILLDIEQAKSKSANSYDYTYLEISNRTWWQIDYQWCRGGSEREKVISIIRWIAFDSSHPMAVDAALRLMYENEEYSSVGYDCLKRIFKNSDALYNHAIQDIRFNTSSSQYWRVLEKMATDLSDSNSSKAYDYIQETLLERLTASIKPTKEEKLFFGNIALNPEHPKAQEALDLFLKVGTAQDKRKIARAMAQNPNHPKAFDAIKFLMDAPSDGDKHYYGQVSEEEKKKRADRIKDKEIAYRGLTEIVQNYHLQNTVEIFEYVKNLLKINNDDSRTLLILMNIASIQNHPNAVHAYDLFFAHYAKNYYTSYFSTPTWNDAKLHVIQIANNSDHSKSWDAINKLFNTSYREDKAEAFKCLNTIVKNPLHEKNWEALLMLQLSAKEEDKAVVYKRLYDIARDFAHPKNWQAITTLEVSTNSDDVLAAHECLRMIAQNPDHPKNWEASTKLEMSTNPDDKAFAYECLRVVAQNPGHLNNWEAVKKLVVSTNPDNKAFAYKRLRIIAQDLAYGKRWDAILLLRRSQMQEDKNFVQNLIIAFADTPGDPHQKNAIKLLRESNDPEEQRIGLELKLKHFPVVFNPVAQGRMNLFNKDAIRAAMPQPLPDLSDLEMDVAAEFQEIMRLMSANETDGGHMNPYYLSPRAINGSADVRDDASIQEKELFLSEIRNRASGFLKTLTGQPLLPGETEGWQMYDANKPDMINSLKHIILALKEKLKDAETKGDIAEIQTAMSSLGIVLNGILYCPTGQAEGIESAINFLIRGKNIVSTNLKELFDKYIVSSSVQKAFNNAFHEGGGVHGIARARMALSAELGMRQAIGTFKERISPVADTEIPEFYNKFYIRFSPKFILDEARRNVQTAEEADFIQAAKTSEERAAAKNIKVGKPISVGEIIAWLNDHGEQDQLHDRFGVSEDYKSISDAGLISLLIKMGYLSDCDTNHQYIQQLWEKSLLDPVPADLVDLEKQWEADGDVEERAILADIRRRDLRGNVHFAGNLRIFGPHEERFDVAILNNHMILIHPDEVHNYLRQNPNAYMPRQGQYIRYEIEPMRFIWVPLFFVNPIRLRDVMVGR